RHANSVSVTPMSGIPARRALGLSTPRRAPQTLPFASGSSPLAFPSSSPAKTHRGRVAIDSDPTFPDSELLAFPS
ncbi:hypothetical protein CY34DRAFT_44750, partial [Suillus luteus UH-Slu-Lm8-n1]